MRLDRLQHLHADVRRLLIRVAIDDQFEAASSNGRPAGSSASVIPSLYITSVSPGASDVSTEPNVECSNMPSATPVLPSRS